METYNSQQDETDCSR